MRVEIMQLERIYAVLVDPSEAAGYNVVDIWNRFQQESGDLGSCKR